MPVPIGWQAATRDGMRCGARRERERERPIRVESHAHLHTARTQADLAAAEPACCVVCCMGPPLFACVFRCASRSSCQRASGKVTIGESDHWREWPSSECERGRQREGKIPRLVFRRAKLFGERQTIYFAALYLVDVCRASSRTHLERLPASLSGPK